MNTITREIASFSFVLGLLVCSCGTTGVDEPDESGNNDGGNSVIIILRPSATTLNVGLTTNGAGTVHECLNQPISQAPPPVGDGTDTSFVSATVGSAAGAILDFDAPSGDGLITSITLRVSHFAVRNGGPGFPPSPPVYWSVSFIFDDEEVSIGTQEYVPGTPGGPVMLGGTLTGLRIPLREFNDLELSCSLAAIAPGHASDNQTWSLEIELEVIPAMRVNSFEAREVPGPLPQFN